MWSDQKFCALSPLPPSGQGLWLYLLSGQHTTNIPGLSRAGRASLSEQLGWSIEDFAKAFQEVFDLGMAKADWQARVLWLPNAIRMNSPQSPNVIKGWVNTWESIPDCDIKDEAYYSLRSACYDISEPYGKAFDKAIRKPFAKSSLKTRVNQEQEQEQLKPTHASGEDTTQVSSTSMGEDPDLAGTGCYFPGADA